MSPVSEALTPKEALRATHSEDHPPFRLRCPVCKRGLSEERRCNACNFLMQEKDGILCALPPDRLAYYAKFIADYEHIRTAEGRGSYDKSYYLALPYEDTTRRNSEQWKIRARSYDYLMRRVLSPPGVRRVILDLGAGNCWLSYQLARRGYQSIAVDLLTNSQDGLGAAVHYNHELGAAIPRIQAELNCLPFQDEQFDVAIYNASFHYSEDYEITMREALRCIKADGCVVICDTPWYSREQSGTRMVAERGEYFLSKFGTASNSIKSQEFLTDERLSRLGKELSIRWTVYRPWHGWRWGMRPLIARLRRRRPPSQFRIYVARKDAR